MKCIFTIVLSCLLFSSTAFSAPKYWVGPLNGRWSSSANWSDILNGSGGAIVPGNTDSVIFVNNIYALVLMDMSPTISSLRISGNVTLYASTAVVFTILKSLYIRDHQTLKDSTSANVSFNVVFKGDSGATANIYGDWVFEGGVAVSGLDNRGAKFIAEAGSKVTVTSIVDESAYYPYEGIQGGRIIFKRNSGALSSNAASLIFSYNSTYVIDNKTDVVIPLASWALNLLGYNNSTRYLDAPASSILVTGNMLKLQFLENFPSCGNLIFDLPGLTSDVDLMIPDGSKIQGDLKILNTNNHTLTLLANNSTSVHVEVGTLDQFAGGVLLISGNNTKVALGRATVANPATSFTLLLNRDFQQTGGNFSLQDFNAAAGFSTLDIRNNLKQSGGTFITNSTSADSSAKFLVIMGDPNFYSGPAGQFSSQREINMSSGTIDNARHMVTLQINHTVYFLPFPNGVLLQSPLTVGKLELIGSPLTTGAVNILTVADPGLRAITMGGSPTSYVNGPLRRATNSMQSYLFPTGKGNMYPLQTDPLYSTSFVFDSCFVVPASAIPSLYQGEYFKTGYPDGIVTAPLISISRTKYWDITKIQGADALFQLKLNEPIVTAAGSDKLVVAHHVSGNWVPEMGSVLSPCASPGGYLLSKELTTYSAFTFGYLIDSLATSKAGPIKGLAYDFYLGVFNALPDFNTLTPVKSGTASNVDIGIRPIGVEENFAFKWKGFITIKTPGAYTFETLSADGSKIYFNIPYCANAAAVVNNDSVHGIVSVKGTLNIDVAGDYPITITYFGNSSSGKDVKVFWTGPGISRQQIPDSVFSLVSLNQPAKPGNGLTYKYYQGSFSTLPDFNTLTPLKTGTCVNIDISKRPADIDNNFAFVWEGHIKIPAPGTYTFETFSDDGSKMYFNNAYSMNAAALVNNDGIHYAKAETGVVTIDAAGYYPVTFTFFENSGGENMKVYWSGPGIPRQLIPDEAFGVPVQKPGKGLSYKYYQGAFSTLPDFSKLTSVQSGTSANVDISVRPTGYDEGFAFVWEGYINIPAGGDYTFETNSDDGSRLYFNSFYSFNNKALVDNDSTHPAKSATGKIHVPEAGLYPISITFFENYGGESMQVFWSGPGFDRQVIPDAAFSPVGSLTKPVKGLQYKYYEGSYNSLPDFSNITPVKTGNSTNVDISIRPTGVSDNFAFIWEGYINITTPGTYTFETMSDDGSKFYFNNPYSATGSSLVTNDGLHAALSATGTVAIATAGWYPVSITYFEKDGGETMQVYWTGPGIERQLIPDEAFTPVAAALPVNGLRYKYYEGTFDILPDFSALSPVKTGNSANVNIGIRPEGVNNHFAFTWEGYINLPAEGTYTFETESDDGSKVYLSTPYSVNGSSLVNNDGLHAPQWATGNITVTSGGVYPITITFFEKDGGETMKLYWTGPGISRQQIPDTAFTANNVYTIPNETVKTTQKGKVTIDRAPDKTGFSKIYPNPFVESFMIDYYYSGSDYNKVQIGIYDLKGRLIYTSQLPNLAPGYNQWIINLGSKNISGGVYMAQLTINGRLTKTVKLVKTK